MADFDIAILCGRLLTMTGKCEITENKVIGIRGSTIAEIFSYDPKKKNFKAKEEIDALDSVVMPGLINGHGHLAMTLFRGLADDLPLKDWLNNYIFPLEAKIVDRDFVRLGAELACLENILSGTTTVQDAYFHEDVTCEVVDKSGLRGFLGESVFDFPGPDAKQDSEAAYKILDKMCDKYSKHERITPHFFAHAPYTCSDETLKKVISYAKKHKIWTSIHLAETKWEVDSSLEKYKKTPAQRLYDVGFFECPSVLAHGVHLSDADIKILASVECSVIFNPESNMKLGSGVCPVPKLRAAGVPVGLGTDGAASNNNLCLFTEMDAGAKVQKLSAHDNTAITALDMLKLATIEGAVALGLDKKVGSLEVGKLADIITVNLKHAHMQPLHNIHSQLVYAARGHEVENVICHGKILMRRRKPTTLNVDDIVERARAFRIDS